MSKYFDLQKSYCENLKDTTEVLFKISGDILKYHVKFLIPRLFNFFGLL